MKTRIGSVSIVIGSWGSYNECNERALGSKWLDLSEYTDWNEIVAELEREGFDLNGIDEELFIQDIDGLETSGTNWDYIHPKELFEMLQEAGVLTDGYKYTVMEAYLEVEGLRSFFDRVSRKGHRWDDDIILHSGLDWEAFGREYFDLCGYKIDDPLLDFFDFEAYGRYIGEYAAHEYSDGLIEILD